MKDEKWVNEQLQQTVKNDQTLKQQIEATQQRLAQLNALAQQNLGRNAILREILEATKAESESPGKSQGTKQAPPT